MNMLSNKKVLVIHIHPEPLAIGFVLRHSEDVRLRHKMAQIMHVRRYFPGYFASF